MKLWDLDSPFMRFWGNAFDFFMIFVMTLVLCIPVITAGAAMTAGAYVAMKIMRKEAPALFPSYFKAFKDNFKQSTIMWLIQLVIIAVIGFDWLFFTGLGWKNVYLIYKVMMVIATVLIIFFNMTQAAVIARFSLRKRDVYKVSFILALSNSPLLLGILAVGALTVIGGVWFIRLLPLFFICGFTAMTALYGFVMMKIMAKFQKKLEGNDPEDYQVADGIEGEM